MFLLLSQNLFNVSRSGILNSAVVSGPGLGCYSLVLEPGSKLDFEGFGLKNIFQRWAFQKHGFS